MTCCWIGSYEPIRSGPGECWTASTVAADARRTLPCRLTDGLVGCASTLTASGAELRSPPGITRVAHFATVPWLRLTGQMGACEAPAKCWCLLCVVLYGRCIAVPQGGAPAHHLWH